MSDMLVERSTTVTLRRDRCQQVTAAVYDKYTKVTGITCV